MSPCYAGVASLPRRPSFPCATPTKVMARLIATTAGPLNLANGSSHYRIGPRLEITRPLTFIVVYEPGPSGAAHQMVIDRDWIHGVSIYDTARGVTLGGVTYTAVVESYLNDFHCAAQISACQDSQRQYVGTLLGRFCPEWAGYPGERAESTKQDAFLRISHGFYRQI
jgi:hypothetical protein